MLKLTSWTFCSHHLALSINLIAIGTDKVAERAFGVSHRGTSCLLAASYIIHFWMGVCENFEISSVEEKDREGKREDFAGEGKDKMNEIELKTVGEKGPEKIMDLGRFWEGR